MHLMWALCWVYRARVMVLIRVRLTLASSYSVGLLLSLNGIVVNAVRRKLVRMLMVAYNDWASRVRFIVDSENLNGGSRQTNCLITFRRLLFEVRRTIANSRAEVFIVIYGWVVSAPIRQL